jgi:tRNA threonylcarbamoyl adenosine modification protein YeaZ
MKILAIDASALPASCAIQEDGKLLGEFYLDHERNHSVTLLPLIDDLLKATDTDPASIDYVAVTGGPGSFTGLRIGSATAKGLCFAWKKEIISVPTVDAIAYNLFGMSGLICPIMDARRHQTYTGIYRFIPDGTSYRFEKVHDQFITTIDKLLTELDGYNEHVTFLGDGVPVFKDYIDENIKSSHSYAPFHMNRQSAGAVVALSYEMALRGETVDSYLHRPIYLRETQAERERKEKNG